MTDSGTGPSQPPTGPPLRRLRLVAGGFAAGMVVVVAALGVSLPLRGEYPVAWAAGWAGVGITAALAGAAVRSRMAARISPATEPAEVVDRYTARMVTSLVFAEVPVLAATAVAFWIDGLLPALLALPPSLALLLWWGPTDADLRALQDRVDAAGGSLDVGRALRTAQARGVR